MQKVLEVTTMPFFIMSTLNLKSLGCGPYFEEAFKEFPDDYHPGRICARYKNSYKILTTNGEVIGTISGKMHHRKSYPAVGDWVLVSRWDDGKKATIEEILPRKTKVSRKIPGKGSGEQVLVANVDSIFIVTSLNKDFNLKRIERYLAIVWESGAKPVIILNKADLCGDISEKIKQVETLSGDVPIHVVSALDNSGIDELLSYLEKGRTVALLGSSGVGKSTLINAISEENTLKVQEVRRADDRGRHTTTHRELYMLKNGGMVIDNPGMREIQLVNVNDGLKETFSDIEELGTLCKFKDCKHVTEPKCAVKKAVEEGTIPIARLESYNNLKREMRYSNLKDSMPSPRAADRAKWDNIIQVANLEDGIDHQERAALKRKLRKSEDK